MPEDKLRPDQRLRLEALALSLHYHAQQSPQDVVAVARVFEQYIEGPKTQ